MQFVNVTGSASHSRLTRDTHLAKQHIVEHVRCTISLTLSISHLCGVCQPEIQNFFTFVGFPLENREKNFHLNSPLIHLINLFHQDSGFGGSGGAGGGVGGSGSGLGS